MTNEVVTLGDLRQKNDEDYLEHFGIKGMKWGVRHPVGPDGRVGKSGAPEHIDLEAKNVAKEHAIAINKTGTGSVIGRRAMRAKIEEKSKNPDFKKAFEYHRTREENKYIAKQIAKAVAPELAIGAAYALYHFNGYSLKVNGPLLKSSSKAVSTGARFVANFGPQMVNDYKFRQITKNF